MKIIETDNLIIGSGPGGSTIVNSFMKEGLDCFLVEEGNEYINNDDLIDNNILNLSEELKKKWRNGGVQFTFGNQPMSFSEGFCFGGGSEINSGIYQEVSNQLIDHFAKKYKIEDFNSSIINEYYSKIKKLINIEIENNNSGFPSLLIKKLSKSETWSIKDLPRISKKQNNLIKDSRKLIRQSMSNTLLENSKKLGLKYITKTKIIKLIIKNNSIISAIGIDHSKNKKSKIKFIAKNFFICCGAVQSPILLKNSNIKKNIGNYFRLHPTLRLIVKFPFDINSHKYPLPLHAITEFLPDIRLSGTNFSLGIFSSLIAEDWQKRNYLIKDWKKIIILYVMIRPKSYGKIYKIPFVNQPFIYYNLINEDYKKLSFGLKKYISALFKNGAEQIIPCINNIDPLKNNDDINCLNPDKLMNKNLNLMSIHLLGSCIPGNNLEFCATNSYGLIRDINNCYVCDASQLPESIGVNPQATIMAMAYRNIDKFLNK